MPLDPILKSFLAQLYAQPGPKMWEFTPAEARQAFALMMQFVAPKDVVVGKVEDLRAPGPIGDISLRSYTPPGGGNAPLPVLIFFHGGGFVIGNLDTHDGMCRVLCRESGAKVIAVDYRLLPQYPFPAAMDDVMAVWKEISRRTSPGNIGVFGSSAGGAMALSLVQRAKREGVPLPGAVLASTPYSDLSKTGDTYYANDGVDSAIRYDGFWASAAKLYAHGIDLKDPRLSPVYGDFTGFPPTALVTGTRDLYLSNTVRVHQKLLNAHVMTELYVEEGESHMGFLGAILGGTPEGKALYSHLARFFDSHLGAQQGKSGRKVR